MPSPSSLGYYEYAKLASAAYIRLESEPTYAGGRVAFQANGQARLPLALANQTFNENSSEAIASGQSVWTIPNFGPDRNGYFGNDPLTGFAATLFEKDGQHVLAIRGTEPTGDQRLYDVLIADLQQIGFMGVALDQAVSMVNLILRMREPQRNTSVLQFEWKHTVAPLAEGIPQVTLSLGRGYIYLVPSYTAKGLELIGPNEKIIVTGHSLGGHLAAFAARLFPSVVSEAYTYNAPGFDPEYSGKILGTIIGFLSKPAGIRPHYAAIISKLASIAATPMQITDEIAAVFGAYLPTVTPATSFTGLPIRNFESEDLRPGDDFSLVSSFLSNENKAGLRQDIATEANSHLIEPFMDSHALHALLFRMNRTLTLQQLATLLKVTAEKDEKTQERIVDALYKIVGTESLPDLPTVDVLRDESIAGSGIGTGNIGMGAGNIEGRREYYEKLLKLEALVKDNPSWSVVSLAGKTSAELIEAAGDAGAVDYRYALQELNPFALIGADYTRFNQDGQLNHYDEKSEQGLTDKWLEARAEMLFEVFKYNDYQGSLNTKIKDRYEDRQAGIKIDLGSHDQRIYVLFGGESKDTLIGSKANDKLFGGDARDVLNALEGDDYLEGNAGDDTLEGGFGNDELLGGLGEDRLEGGPGNDKLFGGSDNDTLLGNAGNDELNGGKGDDVLDGGKGFDTYIWNLNAGTEENPSDGSDTILDYREGGQKRGKIMFMEGDLAGTKTLVDPNNPKLFTDGRGVRYFYTGEQGSLGQLLIYHPDHNGKSDLRLQDFKSGDFGIVIPLVEGPPKTDHFGDEGSNFLDGTLLGSFIRMFGRGGQDRIVVAGEQSEGHGGPDMDFVTNGAGDQYLYGDEGNDILIASGGDDQLYGGEDHDALQGGLDADYLTGDAGNDVASGGFGADVIEGGEGNDFLFGDLNIVAQGFGGFQEGAVTMPRARAGSSATPMGRTTRANCSSGGLLLKCRLGALTALM